MSQETWEILCGMKTDDVELQLALQCAPLITGLKISNLLTISSDGFCLVEKIISGSFISMYPLLETEEKTVILLYQKERLEKYLRMMQVQKLLTEEFTRFSTSTSSSGVTALKWVKSKRVILSSW